MKLDAKPSMYFHVTANKPSKIFGGKKRFYLHYMTSNRINNLQVNLYNY